jgi:hypothetical protein
MHVQFAACAIVAGEPSRHVALSRDPVRTLFDPRAMLGSIPGFVRAALRLGARRRMIRKLQNGKYRIYSRSKKNGKRRNLGTFKSLAAAKKHERAIQFFKRA